MEFSKDLIQEGRACGNTTRLTDFYIQKLFLSFYKDLDPIEIKAEVDGDLAQVELINRIRRRLKLEHPYFTLQPEVKEGVKKWFLIQKEERI